MLDFFCSFDGCSMSMSYNDWPSTMATRSSSACVALISIRFIVAFLASGYRAERHGVSPLDTVRRPFAQARGGRLGFPALRHHGRPRERFTLIDRKSTRLNSSHSQISYAVFCLKKKKKKNKPQITQPPGVSGHQYDRTAAPESRPQ